MLLTVVYFSGAGVVGQGPPPVLPSLDGGQPQVAAAADAVTVTPTVLFSSTQVAKVLPALDPRTHGLGDVRPEDTRRLPPANFTSGWRTAGWPEPTSRFYYMHVKPYLGNAYPQGHHKALPLQVRSVRT
jgi:hypothetical protein